MSGDKFATNATTATRGEATGWFKFSAILDGPWVRQAMELCGRGVGATRESDARLEELAFARFNAAYANTPAVNRVSGQPIRESEGRVAPKEFHSAEAKVLAKNTVGLLYIGREGAFADVELRFRDTFPPQDRAAITKILNRAHFALQKWHKDKNGFGKPLSLEDENQIMSDTINALAELGVELRFLKDASVYSVAALIPTNAKVPPPLESMRYCSDNVATGLKSDWHASQIGLIRGGAELPSRKGDHRLEA